MKLLLFLLLACAATQAAQETELKDAQGNTVIRYVVEAPPAIAPAGATDPTRQVGLILCFPEHDHPTGDEILPVRESLRRLGLSDQFVLLAGHPQAQKFGPADHAPISKLIAWAQATYPINPRRIYMYGKGEGAKISGEFGSTHPNLITAGITYSWGWWMMPSEVTQPIDFEKTAPEFYMVLGMRDLATHIATVRDTYGRVKAKGYHVIYREIDNLGARTYHPPTNDDAIAWATRLRNKNVPPSPAEAKLLKNPVAGTYFEGVALVGGAPAGIVVRKLLASQDAKTRAAAATCSHAIFDEETVAALAKTAVDPDPKVRRASFNALAQNAQWRSAAAQKILIVLAADPNADRSAAVDGLGQAVRLQIKGVQQDPPVFRALVALLTDPNEEIRSMAANILEPVRDKDFRGDSGRPERKFPEGGWPKWLDEITLKDAGFQKDYDACSSATQPPADLFCKRGFANTKQAAEQGYAPAQAALGMMYANGKGVQQDYAEAAKWWTKAAESGNTLAAAYVARAPKTTPLIPQ